MNILIVEDEVIINDYIYHCLNELNYNIFRAYNVCEAKKIINDKRIDLAISDILMPGETGIDLLRFINRKFPVIMLTALIDDEHLIKAYELGAIDYINKPIEKLLLTSKVNNLIQTFLKPTSTQLVNIDSDNKQIIVDTNPIDLSTTEFELFELLYSNSPRAYSKELLIDIIWNNNQAMSEKIVEVNIYNIRKKLGSYSYLIKTKKYLGYYYEDQK